MTKRKWFMAALAAGVLAPVAAFAWWNDDWGVRRTLTLDGASSGVAERIERAPTLVRLHSGVLDFSKVRPDGGDIRFVASDDKTPLNYHLERFDHQAELGFAWVDLPTVNPQGGSDIYLYYGAPNARATANPAATYDGETSLVLHFSDTAGAPTDATANANVISASTAELTVDGMIAGGARFASNSQIRVAPSASTAVNGAVTLSTWIRPAEGAVAPEAPIATKLSAAGEGAPARLAVLMIGGVPSVRLVSETGAVTEVRGQAGLQAGGWTHVAVTADGETLRLYVDGAQVAEAAAVLPVLTGETVLGAVSGMAGFVGDLDEVEQANAARSASQVAFAARTQGRAASFVAFAPEDETADSGGHNYFGVLFNALTVDAWVVIAILGVLGLAAFWVMFEKVRQVNAVAAADRRFEHEFREHMRRSPRIGSGPVAALDPSLHGGSALYRMYEAGLGEVRDQVDDAGRLDNKSVDIVRAALTAQLSRESQRLNRFMVLLTIAISGGPFLGLLGTVVGVMITFAAIAAAGDVNINAIAPGVAAALLATVAGLAVAIPALFGYNYLITRIQGLSADMEVFVDEFVTKIAKAYA